MTPVTQKHLLKVNNLTLEKCTDTCKAIENAELQNDIIKEEQINKIKYNTNKAEVTTVDIKCKFCGGKHEFEESKWPAFGKTCSVCKRSKHFAKVSFTCSK